MTGAIVCQARRLVEALGGWPSSGRPAPPRAVARDETTQFRPVVAVLLPLITGMLSGPAADVLRNLAGRSPPCDHPVRNDTLLLSDTGGTQELPAAGRTYALVVN